MASDSGSVAPWPVVVDNDFAGDPDGLIALAQVLLDPAFDVRLITTTALDPELTALAGKDPARTAAEGAELAGRLLALLERDVPVVAGAEGPDAGGDDAARAIVEAARGTSGERMLLLCGGPLTTVAAALRLDDSLADRIVLTWIGGADAADAGEYNRDTDPAAAASVFASRTPIVQVPREAYAESTVTVDAVRHDLAAASPVGAWLSQRLLDVPPFVRLGATITLGDSALVPAGRDARDHQPDPGDRRRFSHFDADALWAELLDGLRRHDGAT